MAPENLVWMREKVIANHTLNVKKLSVKNHRNAKSLTEALTSSAIGALMIGKVTAPFDFIF